jgi:hypothetical protein
VTGVAVFVALLLALARVHMRLLRDRALAPWESSGVP